MAHLPVIVGMGGINAAGRSSSNQAFCRTVLDALPSIKRDETLLGLISLMSLPESDYPLENFSKLCARIGTAKILDRYQGLALDNTLIRALTPPVNGNFTSAISTCRASTLTLTQPCVFQISRRELPDPIPPNWHCKSLTDSLIEVSIHEGDFKINLSSQLPFLVNSVAQLPQGFDPAELYHSVHHPRALSMAIFGASDCLGESGLVWEEICKQLSPDQIAVYASNSTGQLDQQGWGGLLKTFVTGQRATSKQMALGYSQMPADFINAYVLGSAGTTAGLQGACATFLYNLRAAVNDIRQGRCKVALVGTSDAPILPEIIEGFRVMGALADDQSLKQLNQRNELTKDDLRRSSRPFAENCGFTLGESAQFVFVMDDEFALANGAKILAAVPEVFVNADGWKRSISAPGLGNYITLAKSLALAQNILGSEAIKHRSYIHAHGTSTPKNRVTESLLLHRVAEAFQIEHWPIAAIKAFVGHTQGSAAGDQFNSALSAFEFGIIPGIPTLDAVADDVYAERLNFSQTSQSFDADVTFINAKGFGGNNASTFLLSPKITEALLRQKHGDAVLNAWRHKQTQTHQQQIAYREKAQSGEFVIRYLLKDQIFDGSEIRFDDEKMQIPGFEQAVSLMSNNPFGSLI